MAIPPCIPEGEKDEPLHQNLDLFKERLLVFREPVWGVEHSALKRSKAWKTGTALNLLQDLLIRIRDRDAYAKVTDRCGDGYMIGFTMKQGNLSWEGDG